MSKDSKNTRNGRQFLKAACEADLLNMIYQVKSGLLSFSVCWVDYLFSCGVVVIRHVDPFVIYQLKIFFVDLNHIAEHDMELMVIDSDTPGYRTPNINHMVTMAFKTNLLVLYVISDN